MYGVKKKETMVMETKEVMLAQVTLSEWAFWETRQRVTGEGWAITVVATLHGRST
jgi:hypothetical protein